jgi:hypothetical protein
VMYRVRQSGLGIAPAECASGSFWCQPTTDCSKGAMWAAHPICWSMTANAWATLAGAIAPPGLPSGSRGESPLPPAGSGGGVTLPTDPTQAEAVVTDIVNQQIIDQQAKDAAGVTSSWWDRVVGAPAAAADGIAGTPWLLYGGIGLATVIGLSVMERGRRR